VGLKERRQSKNQARTWFTGLRFPALLDHRLKREVVRTGRLEFEAQPMLVARCGAGARITRRDRAGGYWGGNSRLQSGTGRRHLLLPGIHRGGLLFSAMGSALQGDGEAVGSGVENLARCGGDCGLAERAEADRAAVETAEWIVSVGGKEAAR